MIVYGSSLSPFVRKVLAFAAEKGIDVECVPVSPINRTPEFIEASPFGKMPALRDGDFVLADSSAIIHYLDALKPDPELIPTDPKARGRTIWFDEYADTILAAAGAKMFFNRIVAPRFLGREGDLEVAARAEQEELPPLLDYLETQIPDSLYLVQDRITLADLAVATSFVNFAHLGLEIDSARHPRICAFTRSILQRPSFSTWIEQEAKILQTA